MMTDKENKIPYDSEDEETAWIGLCCILAIGLLVGLWIYAVMQ